MKKNISICVMAAIIAMSVATITGCGADSGISAAGKVSTETKQATSADDTSDNSSATVVDEKANEKATESSDNSNKDSKSENDKVAPTTSKESSDKSSSKTDSNSTSTKTKSSSTGQSGSAKTSGNTSSSVSSENKASKPSSSSSSSKSSSSSGISSSSQKTWHEAVYKTVNHPAETKKVWIVDKKAYSYEEPVYDYVGRTFCNNCGADITDDVGDHMYNHLINGEKKGYHDEWVEIQVGTKTVNVPEEGHWETKVIKEAWTEKILVKEAGYY